MNQSLLQAPAMTIATLEAEDFAFLGRPVRGILLDMDGTIADTKEAHADGWVSWAARHNLPISRQSYLTEYFGRSNDDVIPELFPHLAHDKAALKELSDDKERDFPEYVAQGRITPMPGVIEFIRRCHERGLGLAVASSAPTYNVEKICEVFDIARYIPVRLGMESVKRAKPAPDLFLKAAASLGLDPRDCVVFEDSVHGLQGARDAGCRTVGVLTLNTAEKLGTLADICIDDYEELMAMEPWNRV
ncbi:MAG: HAD family phosphatase [Sumerlaeia bacterium]